ncbi:ATP synthase F1 subunit epsilon [Candidatus Peregrinibacteria bacterium]|nr:ATP synthase F1 subunit epsilon [Candidatus Peregrinibacteria bacterium]
MFKLTIVTAEQAVYDGDIEMLVAPTPDGEIGIMTNHHPLVTKLGPGAIRVVKTDKSEETLFTSGGFLEVNKNKVILLADVVEDIEKIQAEEAVEARKKAQEKMKMTTNEVEREKLDQEIRMLMMRERLAQISQFSKKK